MTISELAAIRAVTEYETPVASNWCDLVGDPDCICPTCRAFRDRAALLVVLDETLDTLRTLHDAQNGPPLGRRLIPWEAAMKRTIKLLVRYGK